MRMFKFRMMKGRKIQNKENQPSSEPIKKED